MVDKNKSLMISITSFSNKCNIIDNIIVDIRANEENPKFFLSYLVIHLEI